MTNSKSQMKRRAIQQGHSAAGAGQAAQDTKYPPGLRPDWSGHCENCNATPIVPATGLCGPCTFGEASTEGGNW